MDTFSHPNKIDYICLLSIKILRFTWTKNIFSPKMNRKIWDKPFIIHILSLSTQLFSILKFIQINTITAGNLKTNYIFN